MTTTGFAIDVDFGDPEQSSPAEDRTAPAFPNVRGSYVPADLPMELGRYVLTEWIGAGGMAEIYKAELGGLGSFKKTLVIKRMLPHLAGEQRFVEMFFREAQVVADLNHTNIVQILELNTSRGQPYIAMEYVDGLSLYHLARRAWTAGRSVPMELAICAIADAATGLHHAYTVLSHDGKPRHLVHRDISPDNLMINRQGLTKILDFGIAKGRDTGNATRTGEIKGKLPYLPPEYYLGNAFDHRGDLYALGVTLYWMLTGQRPFTGATDLLLMTSITQDAPEPPSTYNPAIPAAIEDIVLQLLSKDPNARPVNGAKLAEALLGFVPAERSKLATFVSELLEQQEPPPGQPHGGGAGIFPATPVFERLGSAPLRRHPAQRSLAAPQRAPSPERPEPSAQAALSPPNTVAEGELMAADSGEEALPPRRALPLIAALVGVASLAALALYVVLAEPGKDDGNEGLTLPPKASPVQEALAPAAPTAPAEPKPATPAPSPPEKRQRLTKRAPRKKQVQAKAPPQVQWSTKGGKRLGTGTGPLTVPKELTEVIATDPKLSLRTKVPIRGGVADYGALPKGKLSVFAFPFAEVYAGKKSLGATPFIPPKKLKVGRYRLRLVHEGKVKQKTVVITAGKTAKLKVDMMK